MLEKTNHIRNMTDESSPTRLTRRQRNHEAMKQTILETARMIMRAEGVAALTIQELARRLEIRPPSLYNYFKGKMDIYDHLFRQGFELFARTMQAVGDTSETYWDDMRLSMEAYMSFAQENPELFQLCFERHVPGFEPSEESMQVANQAREISATRIAALIEGGDFVPRIPFEKMFYLVFALMHGLTALHLANEPQLPQGQGRYGSLIPEAVEVFEKAWKYD